MTTPKVGKPHGQQRPPRFVIQPAPDIGEGWHLIRDTVIGVAVAFCLHRYDAIVFADILENNSAGRPEFIREAEDECP